MNESLGRWGVLVGCGLLLGGCSGGGGAGPDAAETSSENQGATTDSPPPSEFVDERGRSFRLVGLAKGEVLAGLPEAGKSSSLTPLEQLKSLDRDTLAKVISPILRRGDYEYRMDEPDYETADRILADLAAGGSPDTVGDEPREEKNCCGIDGRSQLRTNTTYPQSATGFTEVGCSGTLISPSTLVTAAHCVYNHVNDTWLKVASEPSWSGSTTRFPRWVFSMDGVDADAAPHTHTDVQSFDVTKTGATFSTTGPGAYIQCYDVSVPGGYADGGSGSFDFAVVDFKTRCGGRPGLPVGYWGTSVSTEAEIESATGTMIGYPATATQGTDVNGNLTWRYEALWPGAQYEAQMWRDYGAVYISGDTWKIRYTQIDTTGGNSGSGISQGDTFFIGSHIGVAAGDAYNFGRRWDSTYYNFVDANSPFPNN